MKARSIAQGGMLTGISIILLELGAVIEIASGAAALLASLVPAIFFLRDEPQVGKLVYGATSALAVLIVPDKFTALLYALVLGLFTVVKCSFHWERRRTRVLCKATLIAFWVLLSVILIRIGFIEDLAVVSPLVLLLLVGGWTLFMLYYDFCMTRIYIGMRRQFQKYR